MGNVFHTIIIGAGQAGLSAGYYLKQQAIKFLVIEKEAKVGNQWRKRFKSLTLFTPNNMNTLPGFSMPVSNGSYQTKDEFADYLYQYSQVNNLPIKLSTNVIEIARQASGDYKITTNNQTYITTHIIMATGAFKDIAIPELAQNYAGKQLTINQLSNTQLHDNRVLVVGDGASGRQVAKLLSENNSVCLAQGKPRHLVKETIAGFNTFALLRFCGLLRLPKSWKLAQWLKQRDPFPDTQINDHALIRAGIKLLPKLTAMSPKPTFSNNYSSEFDVVVWATGYQNQSIPFTDETLHQQPNRIWNLGEAWQFNRASGLIYGAQFDAKIIVQQLLS